MAENAKWYVVHTYSGYENAVKTSIEKFVTGRGMEDMILRIEIPLETVTEVTDSGATKEVERKVFPGYVLIKMVMTDDTWHLVRNVRGVTGFVGSANKPIPLTEEEVLAMGMEARDRRQVQCGRPCQHHGRPAGKLYRRCGGDRAREEPGERDGLHVRTRDAGGTGAGPGRGPGLSVPAVPGGLRRKWEGWISRQRRPRAATTFMILGGATPWHRRLLVM